MRLGRLAVAGGFLISAFAAGPGCASDPGAEDDVEESTADISTTNDNDRTAFLFFVRQGLTKTQAAGIVGNLDQESSMNPKSIQLRGGPGRGIGQWSVDDRWVTENSFAESRGADPWALQTQLDFIWNELTTDPSLGLASLRKATTLASAVKIFQKKYEACGKCAAGHRLKYAQAALAAFGKEADQMPPEPSSDDKADDKTPSTTTAAAPTDL